MLTEGWDANTVSHILGIRAFGSQLLCEQVVGRGLRRRFFYVPEPDTQFFAAEYSNVYGIPFAFIPSDKPLPPASRRNETTDVVALDEREHLKITFPVLSGYRVEIPDVELVFDPADAESITIDNTVVPSWVESEGIVGEKERIEGITTARPQQIAFEIAGRVLSTFYTSQATRGRGCSLAWSNSPRRTSRHACTWGRATTSVTCASPSRSSWPRRRSHNAITRLEGEDARRPRLRPILRSGITSSSTSVVAFRTRKKVESTQYSHVNNVTLDGKDGNEWERTLARPARSSPRPVCSPAT